MFRYLIFGLIIITSTLVAVGQSDGSHCPKLEVVGPAGVVWPGDTATFSINLGELDNEKLRYQWTVSAGTVESGQNTFSIVVRTTVDDKGELIANVQIEGLPQGCTASASKPATIQGNCMSPITIADYGRVSPRYELQQIMAAVDEWRERDRSDRLVIVLHSDNAREHKMVDDRVRIISKHLAALGVSKDNYAIVKSRTGVYRTKIYVVPPKC